MILFHDMHGMHADTNYHYMNVTVTVFCFDLLYLFKKKATQIIHLRAAGIHSKSSRERQRPRRDCWTGASARIYSSRCAPTQK